jgi:hypothetical protein
VSEVLARAKATVVVVVTDVVAVTDAVAVAEAVEVAEAVAGAGAGPVASDPDSCSSASLGARANTCSRPAIKITRPRAAAAASDSRAQVRAVAGFIP